MSTQNKSNTKPYIIIPSGSKYPKKPPGLHRNKNRQKIHQPRKIHTDRLVNNFVIHQKIPQPPRKLKQLFNDNDGREVMEVMSLAGRPIIIIVFKYPAFDRHIPVENYACEPKQPTAEVIATCPSYICAFDCQTYDILDVVPVLGEIKCLTIHREFVALKIATEFGYHSSLLTYALSPESYKFQQIHQPIEIGVEGAKIELNVGSIEMNYITLPATTDTTVPDTGPIGRLIIYARNGINYGYSYEYDILFTYNHFQTQDSDGSVSYWQFHKSVVINGLDVDITKYTPTDIFVGEDIEYRKKGKNTKNKNDDKIRRIVSLSMDNSDITAAISELYKPALLSYTQVSVNDYILHQDGRLELVALDLGRQPLVRGMNTIENLICFKNYPAEKGGMEIIYKTELTGEQPNNGLLVFATNQITVKNSNNLQEYHFQPGNILKYASMKNLQNSDNLYAPNNRGNGLGNNIICSIYSPDGKYLAIHLNPKYYFSYQKRPIYDLNGIILYNRSAQNKQINNRWREIGYINLPESTTFEISFVSETNKLGENLGYNLLVSNTDTNIGFPSFNIIPTTSVLAEKYTELLSSAMSQQGHANLRNVSWFLAYAKSKYIDLVPEYAKQKVNTRLGTWNDNGYKEKGVKLDI